MTLFARQISRTVIPVNFIPSDIRPWTVPIRPARQGRREFVLVEKRSKPQRGKANRVQECFS
jgi:hypothetical protein